MDYKQKAIDIGCYLLSTNCMKWDEFIERALLEAHRNGLLAAYAKAMRECWQTVKRDGASVGARTCSEIHDAISARHLETLQEMHRQAAEKFK